MRGFGTSVAHIWEFRELLANLVRKELKVKYKDSVLGFLWSLVRPLFLLPIYWIVFGKFLRAGIPTSPSTCSPGCSRGTCSPSTLGAPPSSIVAQRRPDQEGLLPPRDPAAGRRSAPRWSTSACSCVVLVGALLVFRYDFFGRQPAAAAARARRAGVLHRRRWACCWPRPTSTCATCSTCSRSSCCSGSG